MRSELLFCQSNAITNKPSIIKTNMKNFANAILIVVTNCEVLQILITIDD